LRRSWFIPLIAMNSTKATMLKLITLLMNSPKLMVAAPTCLAAASEG